MQRINDRKALELNMHDSTRIMKVRMTNAEKNNPAVQASLKEFYAKYKGGKYTVAIFQSGAGDLYQSPHDLLVYNKKKCTELAVQLARTSRRPVGMER